MSDGCGTQTARTLSLLGLMTLVLLGSVRVRPSANAIAATGMAVLRRDYPRPSVRAKSTRVARHSRRRGASTTGLRRLAGLPGGRRTGDQYPLPRHCLLLYRGRARIQRPPRRSLSGRCSRGLRPWTSGEGGLYEPAGHGQHLCSARREGVCVMGPFEEIPHDLAGERLRQFIGGAEGAVGDAGVYLPLPGSSKTLVMFAGPSITLADNHYLQTMYGVTPAQSAASGHRIYDIPHAGTSAAGVGCQCNQVRHPAPAVQR